MANVALLTSRKLPQAALRLGANTLSRNIVTVIIYFCFWIKKKKLYIVILGIVIM